MGRRRRKRRTHKVEEEPEGARLPRTLVVRRGLAGKQVMQLVRDVRRVLMPLTMLRVKERRASTLKDYVQVAGPLGLTHMLLFTRTKRGVNMRVGRLPRGPTLSFRVKSYTLAAQLATASRRKYSLTSRFDSAPLLVFNNFPDSARHLKLAKMTMQGMLPNINVSTIKLNDCRRILLLHYDEETDEVHWRHFGIRAVPTGVTRSIKRVVQTRVPNLGRLEDIADYVLGAAAPGMTSESEMEDAGHAVELAHGMAGRGNRRSRRSAIRLFEIGPRMTLSLMKIEDQLCAGETVYHSIEKRSDEQRLRLRALHKQRREEKEARRLQQERNIEAKELARAEKRAGRGSRAHREERKLELDEEDVVEADGADVDDDAAAADDDDDALDIEADTFELDGEEEEEEEEGKSAEKAKPKKAKKMTVMKPGSFSLKKKAKHDKSRGKKRSIDKTDSAASKTRKRRRV